MYLARKKYTSRCIFLNIVLLNEASKKASDKILKAKIIWNKYSVFISIHLIVPKLKLCRSDPKVKNNIDTLEGWVKENRILSSSRNRKKEIAWGNEEK